MPHLRAAIEAFPPAAVRAWCEGLGQDTFVGSSGRVFPKAFKTSPLLRAWLRRLDDGGRRLQLRHHWIGWDERGDVAVRHAGRTRERSTPTPWCWRSAARAGRGSAPTAAGPMSLAKAGVAVAPLRPANCGFVVNWSDVFRDRFEGQPLKRIELSFGGQSVRGEAIVTRQGLEGGGIYALSAPLREAIAATGEARAAHRAASRSVDGRIAAASRSAAPQAVAVHVPAQGREPVAARDRPAARGDGVGTRTASPAMDAAGLAELINAVPVRLVGTAPLERAISTAGGISFDEIDDGFMLRRRPGVFVAGEMLDWEAPTGGYLLQASFATGAAAARGALAWLGRAGRREARR